MSIKMNEKQIEILDILTEELAEVIMAISKIKRFGIESEHPVTHVKNIDNFEEELGDTLCLIDLCIANGLVDNSNIWNYAYTKREKLTKWSKTLMKE